MKVWRAVLALVVAGAVLCPVAMAARGDPSPTLALPNDHPFAGEVLLGEVTGAPDKGSAHEPGEPWVDDYFARGIVTPEWDIWRYGHRILRAEGLARGNPEFPDRAAAQAQVTYLIDIEVHRYFFNRVPTGLPWEMDFTMRFTDRASGEVLFEQRRRVSSFQGWWDSPLSGSPPFRERPPDRLEATLAVIDAHRRGLRTLLQPFLEDALASLAPYERAPSLTQRRRDAEDDRD